jgi:ribonuclease D
MWLAFQASIIFAVFHIGSMFLLIPSLPSRSIRIAARQRYSSESGSQYKANLYQELSFWRKRTADELQKPLYKILPNKVLESITISKPSNISQLNMVPGMGPVKLKQFGNQILKIVSAHFSEGRVNSEHFPNSPEFWDQFSPSSKSSSRKTKKTLSDVLFEAGSTANGKSTRRKVLLKAGDVEAADVLISEVRLNSEQKLASKKALSGSNLFITGSAGTGKTFLLRYLIQELCRQHGEQSVAVTAPTGIAG